MLEYLFGPRNPTRSWPVGLNSELTFDLGEASLNCMCVWGNRWTVYRSLDRMKTEGRPGAAMFVFVQGIGDQIQP